MDKRERAKLEDIYRDCLSLERRKDLTEYGAGMGLMCIILLKKKRKLFKVHEIKKIRCSDCKKTYPIHNEERCVFCDSKNLEISRK